MISNQNEEIVLEVNNLTKVYSKVKVVDELSFKVKKGELFVLLGENGAGKSTTIHMLCNFLNKSSGEIKFLGKNVDEHPEIIRENIGIVFQNSILDDKLTVKENLYTRGSFYGMPKKEIKNRLDELSKYFDINKIFNKKYGVLSGGEKRRIDIVRALIHSPKILFLDEPTTGLDPNSRTKLWECIRILQDSIKLTIILTTHYLEETENADRALILDNGKKLILDTPKALKDKYTNKKLLCYHKKDNDFEKLLTGYKYKYENNRYEIVYDDSLIKFLYDNKNIINDFEIVKGSMNDVFLNISGKEYNGNIA